MSSSPGPKAFGIVRIKDLGSGRVKFDSNSNQFGALVECLQAHIIFLEDVQ